MGKKKSVNLTEPFVAPCHAAQWAEQCIRQAEERVRVKRHVAAAVWIGEATAAIRLIPDAPVMLDGEVSKEQERRADLTSWAGRVEREILAATDFCPHCKRLVSP